MPRPGVDVLIGAAPVRRGLPTDTGRLFLTGVTERGPIGTAVKITSAARFADTYGAKVSYGYASDYVDAAFSNGVGEMWFSRVPGPTPTTGSLTKNDKAGSPLPTLTFNASSAGSWSSRVTVQIAAGTTSSLFTIVVFLDAVEVERYTDLATPAAAVAALATSAWVRAVDLASATVAPNNNPATAAAAALSAGNDDHTNVTETQWTAALVAFNSGIGPGQVAAAQGLAPTAAGRQALMSHANSNNRVALLDYPDQTSASAEVALRTTDAAVLGANASAAFAPQLLLPGLTTGTYRTVQASSVVSGLIARSDATRNPNEAAAGDPWGYAQYTSGLSGAAYTDAELSSLNTNGINAFRIGPGGVQLYGYRTISTDPNWVQFTAARLRMSQVARLRAAAERFVFRQINNATVTDFGAAMTAVMAEDFIAGALFGLRAQDAFQVVVDASVNTPAILATGEIRAEIWAKYSPFAEHVLVTVTKALLA